MHQEGLWCNSARAVSLQPSTWYGAALPANTFSLRDPQSLLWMWMDLQDCETQVPAPLSTNFVLYRPHAGTKCQQLSPKHLLPAETLLCTPCQPPGPAAPACPQHVPPVGTQPHDGRAVGSGGGALRAGQRQYVVQIRLTPWWGVDETLKQDKSHPSVQQPSSLK